MRVTAKEYQALVNGHRVVPVGDAVPFGALSLTMIPPSLNNLFINAKKGRIKTPEYKAWMTRANLQLRRQGAWHVPGQIRVRLVFNKHQTKADLDNLIKPTLDLLMSAGRIDDDRNVVEVCALFEKGVAGTRIEIRAADASRTNTVGHARYEVTPNPLITVREAG